MKNFILKTLLCSLLASPVLAAPPVVLSAKDAYAKLHALKVHDLKTLDENTTVDEKEMQAQDEVFDTLEEAVNASIKDPANVELQDEIIRVTVIMLKKDPTQFAGEVILPFYEKNRKGFDAALKKISADEAKDVKEAVKSAEREKKRGNG